LLSQKVDEIEDRDFFKDPFSEAELRGLLKDHAPAEAFARKSPSVKKMGLDPDSLTGDDMVGFMLQEPRLIRRPIIKIGDRLVIGGGQKALEAALGDA
jgi:arsenate reductase-like glutaredoxin family protein